MKNLDYWEKKFINRNGRTYFIKLKGGKIIDEDLFQDFTLMIVGESNYSTMYWICHLVPRPDCGENARFVVLSQSDVENPKDYIKGIQKYYPKANLRPACSRQSLMLYFQWLKDVYGLSGEVVSYDMATLLGCVSDIWVLSQECMYKDRKLTNLTKPAWENQVMMTLYFSTKLETDAVGLLWLSLWWFTRVWTDIFSH